MKNNFKLLFLQLIFLTTSLHTKLYCSDIPRSNSPFHNETILQPSTLIPIQETSPPSTPLTNKNDTHAPSTTFNTPRQITPPITQHADPIDTILQDEQQFIELAARLQRNPQHKKKILTIFEAEELKQAACLHENNDDQTKRKIKSLGLLGTVIGINFPILTCFASEDYCIDRNSEYSYAYIIPASLSLLLGIFNAYQHITTRQVAVPNKELKEIQ